MVMKILLITFLFVVVAFITVSCEKMLPGMWDNVLPSLEASTNSKVFMHEGIMTYAGQQGGREELLYIIHPEGVIAKEGSAYRYKYFRKDHLGSTRVVLSANRTSTTWTLQAG